MTEEYCPYCGVAVEICHDDGYGYEEDKIHHQECVKCEKQFSYTTLISFSYDLIATDCLNTGNHNFQLTKTYPPQYAKMKCVDCGEIKYD